MKMKIIKKRELMFWLGSYRKVPLDKLQYPIDKTCYICLVNFSGFTDGVNGAVEHRELFCRHNESISMCNHCKILNDDGIKNLIYRQMGYIEDKWRDQFFDYHHLFQYDDYEDESRRNHKGQHKTIADWIKSYPNGWDCHNKYYERRYDPYVLYKKWERTK